MKRTIDQFIFSSGIIVALLCFSCTSEMRSERPGKIPGYWSNGPASNCGTADWREFHRQAVEESLLPGLEGSSDPAPDDRDTNMVWTGWLNCATITAKALLDLNELVSGNE